MHEIVGLLLVLQARFFLRKESAIIRQVTVYTLHVLRDREERVNLSILLPGDQSG
jgi:hypothetical protein